MNSNCWKILTAIFLVVFLTSCLMKKYIYIPPESQRRVDIQNWYTIELERYYVIHLRFKSPIYDSSNVLLDTIPILEIKQICYNFDYLHETVCTKTYRQSDEEHEKYLLNSNEPNPGEYLDIYSYGGQIRPSTIWPFCELPYIDEDSCKVITISFQAKLFNRVTNAIIDSQYVQVRYNREWDYFIYPGS